MAGQLVARPHTTVAEAADAFLAPQDAWDDPTFLRPDDDPPCGRAR